MEGEIGKYKLILNQKKPFDITLSKSYGYVDLFASFSYPRNWQSKTQDFNFTDLVYSDFQFTVTAKEIKKSVKIEISKEDFPENDYISISEDSARNFLTNMREDDIIKWSKNLSEYVRS